MSTKNQQVQSGLVSLAEKEGALYKKALLCRTGSFKGMYGPVTITAEMIQLLADKYNRIRSQPKNENDFAPVLVDHARSAELIKGRLMSGLAVGDCLNAETGATEKGLYGDLRIDRDQEKVESGQYSQLSITFDDESFEIYEVSFVAVEAARGSQVLAQGEEDMSKKITLTAEQVTELEQKHTQLSQTHDTVLAQMTAGKEARKAICLALGETITAQETEVTSLQGQVSAAVLSIRTVALASQFKGFIREGKLSKAEFTSLKFAELAALPEAGLKALLKSYETRTPSADTVQHGQAGAKPVTTELSAAGMREAIKLQSSKKGSKSLKAEEEKTEAPLSQDSGKSGESDKDNGSSEMQVSDVDETVKKIESMGTLIEKLTASLKHMRDSLSKLSEQDEDKKEGDSK